MLPDPEDLETGPARCGWPWCRKRSGAPARGDARLVDPALWTGPREEALAVQAARAALETELAALYERWETLEALR